jgi:Uma2 family endonuclease
VPAATDNARLRAWTVTLLSLVAEAFDAGQVFCAGVALEGDAATGAGFTPDIVFVHKTRGDAVKRAHISGAAALAVDVLEGGSAAQRKERLAQAAAAGVVEYWLLDHQGAHLFQRTATGALAPTPPDKHGMHYSLACEELAFPVAWFESRPGIFGMLAAFGLIDGED